jgi:polysaccharide biosynthesis transport protein
MNTTIAPDEQQESLKLGEYIWVLFRHKWLILGFLVAAVTAGIVLTIRTKPVYQASATFIYDASSMMSQTLNMSSVFWFEMDPMRNNQMQIIGSRSMAEAVADSILRSPNSDSLVVLLYGGLVPSSGLRSSLIGMVRSSCSVSIMKDSDFFVLSAIGCSPVAAATMANLVVQTYYGRNLTEARGENAMVREFLAQQIDIMEVELALYEDSLTAFKEEHGIVNLSSETVELIGELSAFETAAATSATEQGALEAQRNYYEQMLDEGRQELPADLASMNTVLINRLETDISIIESARTSLLAAGEAPDSPAVADLESEISARTGELSSALEEVAFASYPYSPASSVQSIIVNLVTVEAQVRAERIREASLRSVISEYDLRMAGLPKVEMDLARLERSRTVSEQIYLLLRTKYEEVRITEAGQTGNVMIMDTALPGLLIAPDTRKNLMIAIFAGLALGIGIVFLKEQLDTTIQSPEDIEALGIPVIGLVPRITRRDPVSSGLIMITSPRETSSEAYRDLRTSLRFSRTDTGIKSLLVTSAGPQEGKSTTAGNLAVAIAQTGSRVLLVDTDLRRPIVHNMFGVPREPGFSEVIAGMETLGSAVKASGVDNLSILTSGFIPHNPSELLGSQKFLALLHEAVLAYDMVIFDSPPVAVVTDAILVSPEMDATLLVVGAKTVDRMVLQAAWLKLERSGAHLVGALLNRFDPVKMYTSYKYYTYRYHYYYDGPSRKKRKISSLSRGKQNSSEP